MTHLNSGTVRLALLGCLLTLPALVYAADAAGSRDPLGLERFPFAWIEDYSNDTDLLPREFIVSPVEKIRRDLHIERKVRVRATRETATYRIPNGTPRADIVDHYVRLLGRDELFSCSGRDCGRSNQWANNIFRTAYLYGPDVNQFYLAADHAGHLVSVYVIERGNKRLYAHLEVLKPETGISLTSNEKLTQSLAGDGFAVIGGVTPRSDGSIPEEGEAVLQSVAELIAIFSGQKVFVVCHLYGSQPADDLLTSAGTCSERAKSLLESEGGPELVGFAAGPLLPRAAGAIPRIELVLPPRLNRE